MYPRSCSDKIIPHGWAVLDDFCTDTAFLDVGLVVDVESDGDENTETSRAGGYNENVSGVGTFDSYIHGHHGIQNNQCETTESLEGRQEKISPESPARVFQFTELETEGVPVKHSFSKTVRSFQVSNKNDDKGDSYSVVTSSTDIRSFNFARNTMVILHPLLKFGSEAMIKCYLPRRHSPSDLLYTISRTEDNPLQMHLLPFLVSIDSNQELRGGVASSSKSFHSSVPDENCNYVKNFEESNCALNSANHLNQLILEYPNRQPVVASNEFTNDRLHNSVFEIVIADHSYHKETYRIQKSDSVTPEAKGVNGLLEEIHYETQLEKPLVVSEDKAKQCPRCGSVSFNFFCDCSRRIIPKEAFLNSVGEPQQLPSPENGKLGRRGVKRRTTPPVPYQSVKRQSVSQEYETNDEPVHFNSNGIPRSASQGCMEMEILCSALSFGNHRVTSDERNPEWGSSVVTLSPGSVRFSMPSVLSLTLKSVIIPQAFVSVVKCITCAENLPNLQCLQIKLQKPLARNISKVLEIAVDNKFGQDPNDTLVQLETNRLNPAQLDCIKQVFGDKFINESNILNEKERENSTPFLTVDVPLTKRPSVISCQNSASKRSVEKKSFEETEPLKIVQWPSSLPFNISDVETLLPTKLVNDTIVDFWLSHVKEKILSEEESKRVHIFNSFFYTSLTKKDTKIRGGNSSGGTRHHRVRKWTKDVDIFSKDYVVVPINENLHWYVAIICFPGLLGPLWMADGSPIVGWQNVIEMDNEYTYTLPPGKDQEDVRKPVKNTQQKKSFIETAVEVYYKNYPYDPSLMRDEASKDDKEDRLMDDYYLPDFEDVESNPIDANDAAQSLKSECPQDSKEEEDNSSRDIKMKQPCILIFNSLPTFPRSRVLNTLRSYLEEEHKKSRGNAKVRLFNKFTMPGFEPNVPQQKNFYDCALYLLQYVEYFFKYPIASYLLPLPHSMRNWFREVDDKRREIFHVIKKLVKTKEPNAVRLLPEFPEDTSETGEMDLTEKTRDTRNDGTVGDRNEKRVEGAKAD